LQLLSSMAYALLHSRLTLYFAITFHLQQALDVQRERKRFENQRFAIQRSAGRLAAVLSGECL